MPNPELDAAGNIKTQNWVCDPIKVYYWKDVFTLPLISQKLPVAG